eukprot:1730425-Lingulodinium_polyedra.AAC.1
MSTGVTATPFASSALTTALPSLPLKSSPLPFASPSSAPAARKRASSSICCHQWAFVNRHELGRKGERLPNVLIVVNSSAAYM